jgi:hypothetical protein
MDPEEITAHLLRDARWSASRSSGPGGQHSDKASTRAELTLEADSLEGLDGELAARLARALGLEAGPLRIAIQDERPLARNQRSPPSSCATAWPRRWHPRHRRAARRARAALPAASGSKPRRVAAPSNTCASRQ